MPSETGHVFEGSLAYTGSAFSASINTMFAGADKKQMEIMHIQHMLK